MPHAYTEDQLVEQPAIGLFAELGRAMVAGAPRALLGAQLVSHLIRPAQFCPG